MKNRSKWLCAVLGSAVCLGAGQTEQRTVTVPWRPQFRNGVWRAAEGLTLVRIYPAAAEAKVVSIEAEYASAVLWHPGGGVRYRLRAAKPADGKRLRIRLPELSCTCAVVHVAGRAIPLPWAPFEADITDALAEGDNEIAVELIGGRKNILGPLHVPWKAWTGPGEFAPGNKDWTLEYQLTDHGLLGPVLLETLG